MLAFIRIDGRTCDVMVMTLVDRRERRVARAETSKSRASAGRATANGSSNRSRLVPDPIRGWRIARISTRNGVREELTLPNPGTLGDYNPSVSPDGSRIAFIRGINGATSDLHVIRSPAARRRA